MNAGVPSVREILVESYLWWLAGRHGAEPDLRTFTREQVEVMYDQVAAVEREHGQTRLEWVMESLVHQGAGYLTADGQIIEAKRPADAPEIPMSLLEAARALYASAIQAT